MPRCFVPRKRLVALALTLTCCASALAAPLEQIGTPDSGAAAMQTYGVDVPVKTALKALLPAGWQLFVHRSVELPPTASWTLGQTWVQALEAFARAHDQAVLIDWNARAVYFRSAEVALEEGAQRAQTAQAATTPLPRLASAVTANTPAAATPPADPPAAAVPVAATQPVARAVDAPGAPISASRPSFVRTQPEAQPEAQPTASARATGGAASDAQTLAVSPRGESAPAATAPVVEARRFEPVAVPFEMTRRANQAQRAPAADSAAPALAVQAQSVAPQPAASEPPGRAPVDTSATESAQPFGSMSFNRAAVGDVLAHAARLHGYSVSFEAPATRFPGAVTLLGTDMGEELRLMARALGPASAVRFELYRGSQVVRVLPAAPGVALLSVPERPFAGIVVERVATTPAVAPVPATNTVAVKASGPAAAPSAPSTAAPSMQTAPQRAAPDTADAMASAEASKPAPVPPAVTALTLKLNEGDSLRDALEQFLRANGFELRWNISEDLQAGWPVSLEGASVSAVLGKLMPRVNLSADIYTPSALVVVRAADAALDK